MKRIRVAVAGVGNCCSALVQGVYRLRGRGSGAKVGILHPRIGGYGPGDIEFVAAFDVDARKVGKDLSQAILAQPNNTLRIHRVPETGVRVQKAEVLDGVGEYLKDEITIDDAPPANVSQVLEQSKAEILLNLLPTGADAASRHFASAALASGCAFINATPAKIASSARWQLGFRRARLPLVGDDLVDQIGATAVHKSIFKMLVDRGLTIDESYQLDIGGGTESLNALDKKRYEVKREIKRASVASVVPYRFPLVAGTSDYVDFMGNSRTSYFWIRGRYFGDAPFSMDITLNIVDGPAGAGTLIDVIRCMKVAVERGLGGAIPSISAYAFKSPPKQAPPDVAARWLEEFIARKA